MRSDVILEINECKLINQECRDLFLSITSLAYICGCTISCLNLGDDFDIYFKYKGKKFDIIIFKVYEIEDIKITTRYTLANNVETREINFNIEDLSKQKEEIERLFNLFLE